MIKRIFALCLSLLAAGVSAQECIPLDSRSGHIRWEVRPSEGDALPAVPAIVPGCVFASYVAAGVEADPNFGDNAYARTRAATTAISATRGSSQRPRSAKAAPCGSASKG